MIEIRPLKLEHSPSREEALMELQRDPYSKYISDNIKLLENNNQWLQEAVLGNLESGHKRFYGIFYHGEVFAGEIGVDKVDMERQTANVFYWVRPSLRNKGIAFCAIELFKNEDFLKGLRNLRFMVDKSNFLSDRVLRKVGAVKEVELEVVYPKNVVRLHNYYNLKL
jgi:RimJ/RimL family protein N-acetyltransferase